MVTIAVAAACLRGRFGYAPARHTFRSAGPSPNTAARWVIRSLGGPVPQRAFPRRAAPRPCTAAATQGGVDWAALLAAAPRARGCGNVMRILSGLAGKMAPVAGPPAKAVPTPAAAFTAAHRRVAAVSQRRLGESRGGEEHQQSGAAMAPHSVGAESQAGRSSESCGSSCATAPDPGGVGTAGSFMVEGAAAKGQSVCSGSDISDSRNVGSSSGRGSSEQQSAFSRASSRDSRVSPLSRGSAEQQQQGAASRSRSRVRQYRKRVCVRWGSLQWSLALVLVVRSAAAGCQGATHRHHHHRAAAVPRTLNVA